MAFTRESVLLRWNSEATVRAFRVLKEEYRGGTNTKPASYARSLYDDSLLAIRASSKRRWFGAIVAEDSPSGQIDSADIGSIDELEAAHAATDLEVKSFEDDDYWDAEWMGNWDAICEYDPMRNRAVVIAQIEEK